MGWGEEWPVLRRHLGSCRWCLLGWIWDVFGSCCLLGVESGADRDSKSVYPSPAQPWSADLHPAVPVVRSWCTLGLTCPSMTGEGLSRTPLWPLLACSSLVISRKVCVCVPSTGQLSCMTHHGEGYREQVMSSGVLGTEQKPLQPPQKLCLQQFP